MEKENRSELGVVRQSRVLVIYAGGTISALPRLSDGARVGGQVFGLLEMLQEKYPARGADLEVINGPVVFEGLSENMDFEGHERIALAVEEALDSGIDGILIPHGTDSLLLTARMLQARFGERLRKSGQRVIVTGANEDTSHPQTDAWQNLGDGLELAGNPSGPHEVGIAFHGRYIPADLAAIEPFNGSEMNYVPINGPGYLLAINRKIASEQVQAMALLKQLGKPDEPAGLTLVSVNRIMTPDEVRQLEQDILVQDALIVLMILYHSGTAHTAREDLSIARVTESLRKAGKVVFGVAVNDQPVDLHAYETSVTLREAGMVPAYDLPLALLYARASLAPKGSSGSIIDFVLAGQQIFSGDIAQLKQVYSEFGVISSPSPSSVTVSS